MDPLEFIILLLMELVGASAGVYWGYKQAVNHERKIRIEEEENIIKLLKDSLLSEIKYNSNVLNKGLKEIDCDEKVIKIFDSFLLIDVFQCSLNSGDYRLLPKYSKMFVSIYYLQIRRMNESVLMLGHVSGNELIKIANLMEALHKSLIAVTETVIKNLESKL